jgi:hypothetical protein
LVFGSHPCGVGIASNRLIGLACSDLASFFVSYLHVTVKLSTTPLDVLLFRYHPFDVLSPAYLLTCEVPGPPRSWHQIRHPELLKMSPSPPNLLPMVGLRETGPVMRAGDEKVAVSSPRIQRPALCVSLVLKNALL